MIDQGWKDEEGRMSEVFAGPEAHSLPVLPRDEVGALVFMTYQYISIVEDICSKSGLTQHDSSSTS